MRPTLLTFLTIVSTLAASSNSLAAVSVDSEIHSAFTVLQSTSPKITYVFKPLPDMVGGRPLGKPIMDVIATLEDPGSSVVQICTNSNDWGLYREELWSGHYHIQTSEVRPNALTWVWAANGGADKCMTPIEFAAIDKWRIKPGGLNGGNLTATRYKLVAGFTMYTK